MSVNWVDEGSQAITIADGSVSLTGNSTGTTGSNASGERLIDLSPLSEIGGEVEVSFNRTMSGSWFDDDFTDAQFVITFFTNTADSSLIVISDGSFKYETPLVVSNPFYITFAMGRTYTSGQRAGLGGGGGSGDITGLPNMVQVNPGDSSEDSGPVDVTLKMTRSNVFEITLDVFINGIHRYSVTDTDSRTNTEYGESLAWVHHHNFSTESAVKVEDFDASTLGPATNEELFQASYADASAADPKPTALIRPADVQRSIDTDVFNLVGGPNLYTVEVIFDIGELENLNPYHPDGRPRVFFVKDDQPGLREGKNLLLKSYQIRDADPSVPVTCTFWG